MKKVFFLTALLCASVMSFADPVTGSSTEKSEVNGGNDFVNGYERSIILDFNCIGNILDYI